MGLISKIYYTELILFHFLCVMPGAHFTKGLWAHNQNIVKILFDLIFILMIQSVHKFARVTTAKLLWHVQNCDMFWLPFFI